MNKPKLVVIHCSASKEGQDLDVKDIDQMHKKRGWSGVGYHFVITLDGKIQKGRPIEEFGAHVRGHNRNSVGVCYIGGLDKNGKPKDTRTKNQKAALEILVSSLKTVFPIERVCGHRDLSPDKNGDGRITSNEWLKQCPCFDAEKEFENC